MKDWAELEADITKLVGTHYNKGRYGCSVNKVVVHYNAGNLTVEGCWSVWQSRPASAHYQVEESGRIGQLVYDSDTAWHAGNWEANKTSIGIEHANYSDGTISDECLDNGAHLVAAICHRFGLERPEWLKNVFPHKYFASTSCPGQIYGSQKSAYIARAQYWYDVMAGKQPEDSVDTEPEHEPSSELGDHRWWGPKVTTMAQQQVGTETDGIISRQPKENEKYALNCETSSWKFTDDVVSSTGYRGSAFIRKTQTKLKELGFYFGEIDGFAGKQTFTAIQKWLESKGYSVGEYGCNGYWGEDSNRAWCRALIDGAVKELA